MNPSANVVDSHYQIAMSSLQDSLAAASAMSPPSASMSPHSLHRIQHSMAFPSSMSVGTDTNQLCPSHNRRPQRNVRFNDQISGVIVPSRDDMSIKERQNIWYSPEDKSRLQENLKNEAKHMRRCVARSLSPESDQTSSRGIEHLTSGSILREFDGAKTAVIRTVLLEQHHQRTAYGANNVDQTRLAMVSSELSLDAKKRAILLAASDQEFALCEYQQDQSSSSSWDHAHRTR